jgi:hypothetical protein
MRKPAIESRVGHVRGIDDIVEPLLKKAVSGAKKGKKVVKKAKNDIPDPKYKKNPYNKKGGLTTDYKDYVLRNSRGDY